jgi:hypothetical protein
LLLSGLGDKAVSRSAKSVSFALSPKQLEKEYLDTPLQIPDFWNLSRKHFRLELFDGRHLKLNKLENRINAKELKFYCWKFKPAHVYFSVLDWLLPERVGKKYKARYCVPLNGNYVVDVDSHMMLFKHEHKLDPEWNVCSLCLIMAKRLTLQLQLCDSIEKYYSKLAIVFSGRTGGTFSSSSVIHFGDVNKVRYLYTIQANT